MYDKPTTKEILNERFKSKARTPLYSQEALNRLNSGFDTWKESCVRPQDRDNWTSISHMVLGSAPPREMIYSPLSNPEFDYERDLGNSGVEPYTRGIHSNMYRRRAFTKRQLAGFSGPEETNE